MTNQPRHVLVVDDDELARKEITRCVEQLGHTVSQAADGKSQAHLANAVLKVHSYFLTGDSTPRLVPAGSAEHRASCTLQLQRLHRVQRQFVDCQICVFG